MIQAKSNHGEVGLKSEGGNKKGWIFSYIYMIIIVIKACRQHGFLWLSLSLSPFISLDGTQCRHKADECKFLLVGQHQCAHVYESIERRLWLVDWLVGCVLCNINNCKLFNSLDTFVLYIWFVNIFVITF